MKRGGGLLGCFQVLQRRSNSMEREVSHQGVGGGRVVTGGGAAVGEYFMNASHINCRGSLRNWKKARVSSVKQLASRVAREKFFELLCVGHTGAVKKGEKGTREVPGTTNTGLYMLVCIHVHIGARLCTRVCLCVCECTRRCEWPRPFRGTTSITRQKRGREPRAWKRRGIKGD